VRRARDAARARRTMSTDEHVADDGATIGDRLGADEPGFEAAERRSTLESLMRCLSPRDQEVMRLRFDEDLTQDEIGSRMHISQMQVSRVLRAAIERLRAVSATIA
jgi:RNA polymerase sigma-B factor